MLGLAKSNLRLADEETLQVSTEGCRRGGWLVRKGIKS